MIEFAKRSRIWARTFRFESQSKKRKLWPQMAKRLIGDDVPAEMTVGHEVEIVSDGDPEGTKAIRKL